MQHAARAVVHKGKIELMDELDLPDGTRVLVTVIPDDENGFWMAAGEPSLKKIWGHPDDDVYEQLLEE